MAGAAPAAPGLADLAELVDELGAAGCGVVMTMGKGGVGKTTLAAALAIALVDRGHDVTPSTTDPAAHVADALAAATGLDDEGRALLEEDLPVGIEALRRLTAGGALSSR